MKADLHIHTHHSGDNEQQLGEIFKAAKRLGLGAIGITDHNTLKGGMDAKASAPPELIVIPAVEVTSDEGHILAYNVSDDVPRGLPVAETIEIIHQLGGIAVAAHPYRLWSGLGSKIVLRNKFDAIEAVNGRNTSDANRKAMELAERAHLPVIGGSDAHRAEKIGEALTIFPEDCHSLEDLIKAILDGRTHIQGAGRNRRETFRYGSRSISQWFGRGMKRL
jgi:predicted metal-dependent phosphoesterase TrpH